VLADGALWLSYNGEIHNFIELRGELEGLGATFRTSSDTEVVLNALAQWGEGAFERFNGMWALALWEPQRRRLLLARDRFGIKPLFWCADGRRFMFASEAKSILAASPEERRW
jgi:asparagine synthase (glutamine-hydrolysing)